MPFNSPSTFETEPTIGTCTLTVFEIDAGIDVDVDDASLGAELAHVADHAIVEAGSDPDEHVAVVHRHVAS